MKTLQFIYVVVTSVKTLHMRRYGTISNFTELNVLLRGRDASPCYKRKSEIFLATKKHTNRSFLTFPASGFSREILKFGILWNDMNFANLCLVLRSRYSKWEVYWKYVVWVCTNDYFWEIFWKNLGKLEKRFPINSPCRELIVFGHFITVFISGSNSFRSSIVQSFTCSNI